jgi:hypothetical protein
MSGLLYSEKRIYNQPSLKTKNLAEIGKERKKIYNQCEKEKDSKHSSLSFPFVTQWL